MSVLLLLGIFSISLFLGFGFQAWNLVAISLLLMIGLAFVMVGVDVEAIKANWAEQRCDFDVILTSFLYKPSDDTRSVGQFASENFSFCARKSIKEFLVILMAPMYLILGKQIESIGTLSSVFDGLRTLKATLWEGFQKILEPFHTRFISTGVASSVVFQRLMSAMSRAGGISVASLYMGIGTMISMENFVKFIIKVVLIIMAIIAALLILIFFGILPLIPLIILTIVTLEEGGFGYMLGDLGSTFRCFDPDTTVILQNGRQIRILDCKAGDVLEDGSVIEGILITKAEEEPIYLLDGIRVSGSHLVWSSAKTEWISVSDHPSASLSDTRSSQLICLRTSTRNIPIRGASGQRWRFRDWEELPTNSPAVDAIWDSLVRGILGVKVSSKTVPMEDPLLGPQTQVLFSTGEKRPVCSVRLGDILYSEGGFTRVIGIYEGVAKLSGLRGITDGVWMKQFGETNWSHPSAKTAEETDPQTQKGFHFITESGTLWLEGKGFSGFVRDFTEVGGDRLFLTYPYTLSLLKKSLNREEQSCVSDFLSQASLSCSQPIC